MSEQALEVEGYYVLTAPGDLVYTPATSVTLGYLLDEDGIRMFWPFSAGDRLAAWTLIVEAAAFGADPGRVATLVDHWELVDSAAYAERVGAKLEYAGGEWCATRKDGTGPAGFAGTAVEALGQLGLAMGLRPAKVGFVSFPALLRR